MAGANPAPRVQPLEALRALEVLARNPMDTAQVFRMARALDGEWPERFAARVRRDPRGRRLLEERPDLLAKLVDREWLASLDEGSLGCAYLAFCEAEGITAEGLIEASESGFGERFYPDDSDMTYIGQRMRDVHDVWHALTGYQGDLVGETSLLAFTFAQAGNPAVGVLSFFGTLQLARTGNLRTMANGFLRGRRATWLVVQPWEELLERPLDEVRRLLRVGRPPLYRPVRAGTPEAERLTFSRLTRRLDRAGSSSRSGRRGPSGGARA